MTVFVRIFMNIFVRILKCIKLSPCPPQLSTVRARSVPVRVMAAVRVWPTVSTASLASAP